MYFGYLENFGGSFGEFVDTRFGLLLTIKMSLALGLLTIFASSPFLFMQQKQRTIGGHLMHFLTVTGQPGDFRIDRFEVIHYVALGFGLGIVVLAKAMFMV